MNTQQFLKYGFLTFALSLAFIDNSFARDAVEKPSDSAATTLIGDLLARGEIDQALRICEQRLADSQAETDTTARWLVLWSQTNIAMLLRQTPDLAQTTAEQTIGKIDHFLATNPNHSRSQWLLFQRELIDLAIAQRDVQLAIVKPEADPARDDVLKRIVRIATRLRERRESIEVEIAIERKKNLDSFYARELVALSIAVATQRIETVMLRGDLFAAGSDDYIASANESLAATGELLESIPPDSAKRDDLVRQLAESLLRTGELEQALATVSPLLEANRDDLATRALVARIALDRHDWEQAEQLLRLPPNGESNANLDFDLTRLQLAMVKAETESATAILARRELGDLIEQIGRRHGDYAKRRAERLVLGNAAVSASVQLDPRIIIAQAASRVREGQSEQAGEMLAAAARNESDPAAAMQLAIAGAASWRQAKQVKNAAELLRETSLTHFRHPDAAKLHLQAAIMLADTVSAESLIEHLQECVATWPDQPSSSSAIDWLVRLHEARGDALAAARAASSHVLSMNTERTKQAGELWLKAILNAPFSEREQLSKEAIESLARLGSVEIEKPQMAKLVVLFRDRTELMNIKAKDIDEPLTRWLFNVRQGGPARETSAFDPIDLRLREAAADRLIADGKTSPLDHGLLANAILLLVGSEASLQSAQAQLWLSNWQQTESIIVQLEQTNPADLDLARALARMLATAGNPDAKRAGLRLWTRISSQLRQGTAAWHESKRAAIEIMHSLGDHDGAKQMEAYIELTQITN